MEIMSENVNDSCEREERELRSNSVYWQKYATTSSYQNKNQNRIELLELGIELAGQSKVNVEDRFTPVWSRGLT